MTTHGPLLTLNNGAQLPAIGLGVFQCPPAETVDAVEAAIGTGYRLIDTAASYLNERQVGEALRNSRIDRGQLVVQTKMWISDYGYESGLRAFDASVRKLGLDHVEVYLLHQPMPNEWDRTVAEAFLLSKVSGRGELRVTVWSAEMRQARS